MYLDRRSGQPTNTLHTQRSRPASHAGRARPAAHHDLRVRQGTGPLRSLSLARSRSPARTLSCHRSPGTTALPPQPRNHSTAASHLEHVRDLLLLLLLRRLLDSHNLRRPRARAASAPPPPRVSPSLEASIREEAQRAGAGWGARAWLFSACPISTG